MKPSQIKTLKPCFGSKKIFMKRYECSRCQFERKCFLKVNHLRLEEVPYSGNVLFHESEEKDLNTYDNNK